MTKKASATPAPIAPVSLLELSRKWAHDVITPEIRSSMIDTANMMADVDGKIRRLADLLHSRGVMSYHVHLTRENKKTLGGDAVSKYDALKIELDTVFDARLTEEQRQRIANNEADKRAESNIRSKYRQRTMEELVKLEKVAEFKDPNGSGESGESGTGTNSKTDHDRGVERLQSALKAFQKVEPETVGYNVQQFCEGLEKLIAHAMAHGKKPE